MAFGRVVRLTAGRFFAGNEEDADARDLSELDMRFEVHRAVTFYDNAASIELWNASPDTIGWLMEEGNSVMLQAGYEDSAVGTIFIGQIADVSTRRDGGGYVTTLNCVSSRGAFYQLSRLHVSIAFSSATTVRAALDTLCAYAGIALRAGYADDLSEAIGRDFNFCGTFRNAIREFTAAVLFPRFGRRVYLDNNELVVVDGSNSVGVEEVVLDHSSGLLSATVKRDESANRVNFGDDPEYYYFSEKEGEKAEEYHAAVAGGKASAVPQTAPIERPREVSFRAVMTPKIAPNTFVEIDSSTGTAYDRVLAVKGRFVVTRCEFRGGTAAGTPFEVDCEAKEVEAIGG